MIKKYFYRSLWLSEIINVEKNKIQNMRVELLLKEIFFKSEQQSQNDCFVLINWFPAGFVTL